MSTVSEVLNSAAKASQSGFMDLQWPHQGARNLTNAPLPLSLASQFPEVSATAPPCNPQARLSLADIPPGELSKTKVRMPMPTQSAASTMPARMLQSVLTSEHVISELFFLVFFFLGAGDVAIGADAPCGPRRGIAATQNNAPFAAPKGEDQDL
jgi:hypothetical protein